VSACKLSFTTRGKLISIKRYARATFNDLPNPLYKPFSHYGDFSCSCRPEHPLDRSGYNIIGANKSQGRFVIGYNDITWLYGPKERTEPGLLLMQNESAALIQGVEDTCMIAFAEMDGRKGVTAHASFSVPPAPPTHETVFIPSE
jgi:hypothetical protein